jgi:hypothetical protein
MSFFTLASGPGYGYSLVSNSPPPAGFTAENVFDNTLVIDANRKCHQLRACTRVRD